MNGVAYIIDDNDSGVRVDAVDGWHGTATGKTAVSVAGARVDLAMPADEFARRLAAAVRELLGADE